MAEDLSTPAPNVVPFPEAARQLKVSVLALRSLIDAGFIQESGEGVAVAELKSFQARNAGGGSGAVLGAAAESTDPEALMATLDKRTDELAQQAYDRFVRVIPDARSWTEEQRKTFIDQARGRFNAILAVMSQGSQVDQTLRQDLEEVGASAAWAGTSLPHLLLVLRISRDLLLQAAMRTTDQQSGRMNAALAAFSARMLPSIDRLTDALADGFWNAKLDQQQEEWHRLASVVEGSSYGVYEADLDGVLQYVNSAFARFVDADVSALIGRRLNEVVLTADGSPVAALLSEPPNSVGQVAFALRSGGGSIDVEVDTVVRRVEDQPVGFGGILQRKAVAPTVSNDEPVATVASSAPVDTDVLVPYLQGLQATLATLAEIGYFIDEHADKLTVERIHLAGASMRKQTAKMESTLGDLEIERRKL